jgi:sulfatase modifying factor 1
MCIPKPGGRRMRNRDWRSPGFAQEDDYPVACVSWNDAKAYVDWLSKQTGHDYRLPSEAEWEFAARAGTTTARFWGDNPDSACRYANVADRTAKTRYPGWPIHDCEDGYVHAAPTGSFKANSFGLKDMLGNLWEWTADCWNGSYEGAPSDGSARTGGDCRWRVLRGGSWDIAPEFVRSAIRIRTTTKSRSYSAGFRPARTL